jgi:hypothetical protein
MVAVDDYLWGNMRVLPSQSPNQQLQRTVIRRRVRAAGAAWPLCACGAHDTSSRGR